MGAPAALGEAARREREEVVLKQAPTTIGARGFRMCATNTSGSDSGGFGGDGSDGGGGTFASSSPHESAPAGPSAAPKTASDWLEASREHVARSKSEAEAKWPRKGIEKPHPHDVLYGRGGGTNHHPGNKRYRKMVEERKHQYVNSKRLEKPLIAFEIIRQWRAQEPPGRFLKKDKSTGLWNDVGDAEARKKTSQALREQAPLIREMGMADLDDDDGDGLEPESTDYERTESLNSNKLSASPEPLEAPGTTPAVEDVLLDEECIGADQPHLHFPTQSQVNNLAGSAAGAASVSTELASAGEGPDREVSWGREHSLGEYPLPHASVSQSALDAAFDHRTGAWATPPNYFAITKELSTAVKPSSANFSSVPRSGGITSSTLSHSAPLPPSNDSFLAPYESTGLGKGFGLESLLSDDTNQSDTSHESDPRARGSPFSAAPGTNPGRTRAPSLALPAPQVSVQVSEEGWSSAENGVEPYYPTTADIAKDAIKRATSHQNETLETKRHLVGPSVKRVALNRDGTTSEMLRLGDAVGLPTAAPFNEDQAMRELTQTMEKSTLLESANDREIAPLPVSAASLGGYDRVTTIDRISLDLISHPVSLSRTNTAEIIDTLASASASSDLDEEAFNQFLDHII